MSTSPDVTEVEPGQCAAMTKSGDRCRNHVVAGSHYCRIHKQMAEPAEPTANERAASVVDSDGAESDIGAYAKEIKESSGYQAPPFCPQILADMLKGAADRLTAWLPTELIKDIAQGLEGTKMEDLLDPETWKGLWYLLNYSAATGARDVLDETARRLSFIPGADMAVQFAESVIESPRDLLSLDTWKGAAVILSAVVQSSASSVKQRVLGGDAPE